MQLNLHRGFHGLPLHCSTRDGRDFRWLKPWAFVDSTGHAHEIPAHDETDGASTPRAIWGLIPPFGKYFAAAAFHDHLYRRTHLPKFTCDWLFLEAMRVSKVPWLLRHLIYWGVKFGGGVAFRNDRMTK